jgi:hypothetical protein
MRAGLMAVSLTGPAPAQQQAGPPDFSSASRAELALDDEITDVALEAKLFPESNQSQHRETATTLKK